MWGGRSGRGALTSLGGWDEGHRGCLILPGLVCSNHRCLGVRGDHGSKNPVQMGERMWLPP